MTPNEIMARFHAGLAGTRPMQFSRTQRETEFAEEQGSVPRNIGERAHKRDILSTRYEE